MKTRKLIVTKSHKYGTRQMTAGEEYELPMRHAIALVAAKKARFADKPTRGAEPTPVVRHQHKFEGSAVERERERQPEPAAETPNLDSLRTQAAQLGISVDGRWGAGRLQYEIEQAKR